MNYSRIMDLDLKGQHILVTGATGGIGKAVVEALYKEGSKITLHGFRNTKTAETLIQAIQK